MYGYCFQSARDARDGWKVDIWFKDIFDKEHFKKLEEYKKLIESNSEIKSTILYFKKLRHERNLKIGGGEIYQRVIEGDVRDFERITGTRQRN